jgi:ribosome recycling factor
MTEEITFTKDVLKSSNEKAIEHLDDEFRKIRVGKATPDMLRSVMVDYYGSNTPLTQVANIGTLDARTLTVQPWE